MEKISEKLKAIAGTGEIIRIIYHGGSQPGTVRAIVPVSIHGDKLTAVCLKSHKSKQFSISKIEIADESVARSDLEYNPAITARAETYETICQILEDKREFLEGLGWYIESGNDKFQIDEGHEQHYEYLRLYSRFKNGNLRKTCDIELSFELLGWDTIYESSDKGEPVNIKKRLKPWIVRGEKQHTKTFGKLDNAVGVFLDWADLLKPLET